MFIQTIFIFYIQNLLSGMHDFKLCAAIDAEDGAMLLFQKNAWFEKLKLIGDVFVGFVVNLIGYF
jgi:hypothetical protein